MALRGSVFFLRFHRLVKHANYFQAIRAAPLAHMAMARLLLTGDEWELIADAFPKTGIHSQ